MSWVQVAVTAVSAFGQVQQGNYAKGQANLQAGQLDYQATTEQRAALETARIIRRAGRRTVGQANAAYAGAGVVVGQGSAGEVEGQIYKDVEHDAFQALLDGDRRAMGLKTDATLTRISGSMQQKAGYVNAAGTALGGAYQGMKSSGWRTGGGPGFSGTQAPAPVVNRDTYYGG